MFEPVILLWRPILEIIFIWALIYYFIRFFQGTRAIQVLMGLLMLAVVFNIAKFLQLNTIIWVLTNLFAVGVVAFLIIFQPELRRALARIGQNTMGTGFLKKGGTIDEVVQTSEHLSRKKIGGLIAIERDIGLRNYIESGMVLDAKISAELLITLFTPNTPTHDGGVIVQNDRIASCGSLFPLSQNTSLARNYGTRHRAAMGLSEETDAVCVIISEETGNISVAVYGKLTRALDGDNLRNILASLFKPAENKTTVKEFLDKNWNLFRTKGSGQ